MLTRTGYFGLKKNFVIKSGFFPEEMGGGGREKEEGKGFIVPSKSLNKTKQNPSKLKICET